MASPSVAGDRQALIVAARALIAEVGADSFSANVTADFVQIHLKRRESRQTYITVHRIDTTHEQHLDVQRVLIAAFGWRKRDGALATPAVAGRGHGAQAAAGATEAAGGRGAAPIRGRGPVAEDSRLAAG